MIRGEILVKDRKAWEEFENMLCENTKADYHSNLKIFEELLTYAKMMGKFPPEDPLEGIETDIRIAKILNNVR
jgi:hypothetical protein